MKYLICDNEHRDLNKILFGQSRKLLENKNRKRLRLDHDNIQESLSGRLSRVRDEIVCFVPPNNMILGAPDEPMMNKLQDYLVESDFDYIRLRRVGMHNAEVEDDKLHLWREKSNTFFLTPHIIRTNVLKKIVDRVDPNLPNQLFWSSLELTGANGLHYHDQKGQKGNKMSYWRCGIFDTISDILNHMGEWHETYIRANGGVISPILAEYNVDTDKRGIGSIGGCC